MNRPLVVTITSALLVAACTSGTSDDTGPTAPSTTSPVPAAITTTTAGADATPADDLHWWNDRVFYEIFVRSFRDADGDGIGDLAGLTASLDYLNDGDPATTNDLGITGIWLMPIFPSPSYHGYDVTDYRAINPDYGTLADFEAFLDAAHERGIAVLIDLVINHTSVEHPWFTASVGGDATYREWYVWSDVDPGTPSPWHGGPMWHERNGEYYFGLFWEGMPDLDLAHAGVTAELHDIARFWLEDVGVDGFRLDAARHLIEDGDVVSDTQATVAWLEDFNSYVDSIAPDALVLGEVWSPTEEVARYVPDALDLAFEFELSDRGGAAVAAQDASIFEQAIGRVIDSYPELQYATFLTNHDMDRMMSAVGGEVRLAKLAATWLLTGPGVPFVYYGEEVGLQGTKPDERIRTPMPWTGDDDRVGFTTGTPWEPVDPGYAAANVADQIDDPESLLSHYRTLIQDRAASEALRRGDLLVVTTDSPTTTAYVRSAGDDHVLVVLNLSPDPVFAPSLTLASGPLAGFEGVTPVVGPPGWAPDVTEPGGFRAYEPVESMPPYGFVVLRFTAEPSDAPPVTTPPTTTTIQPATAEDVATAEAMLAALVGGDVEEALAYFDSDAVYVDGPDFVWPLTQPLPEEAGFDDGWDWNADGIVTLTDLIAAQNAWGAVVVTEHTHQCAADGAHVVCDIRQRDVFGDAAGLAATELRERYRVENDRITVLYASEPANEPTEQWLAQFAAFERWLADTDPGRFDVVFRRPCCAGTPDALWFTKASIEAQRDLIPRWPASQG